MFNFFSLYSYVSTRQFIPKKEAFVLLSEQRLWLMAVGSVWFGGYFSIITNSTRRFCCLPSSVSLVEIGLVSP